MNNARPSRFHRRALGACLAGLGAVLLSACGGGGSGGGDGPGSAGSITLSGSVGDGPVVFAEVAFTDSTGSQVARVTSDASANYSAELPADARFPIRVRASGGTDVVTNAGPDFDLTSVIPTRPSGGAATVNINPFTTLILRTAEAMPGGVTGANLATATRQVLDNLGMGYDEAVLPDPVSSPVTPDNAAMVVVRSEALGELIRRTRDHLASRTNPPDAEAVIAALAGDLADGSLDGAGPGADSRITATALVVTGPLLVETLTNQLSVNGTPARDALDDAIILTVPGATSQTEDVRATAALRQQARRAVAAAQAIAPSASLDALDLALQSLAANATPTAALSSLPAGAASSFAIASANIAGMDTSSLDAVLQATPPAGSTPDNGDGTGGSGEPGAGGDTPPSSSPVTVSDLSPTSYELGTLNVGAVFYIDRGFEVTSLPSQLQGLPLIRTANDDKGITGDAAVTFTVDRDVSVMVAHDTRISPKPAWLTDWTDTGASIETTDVEFRVFQRTFPAGQISLGGNASAGVSGSMYFVALGASATSQPPSGGGSDTDSDGDGIPDSFETANGLDPSDPADAGQDADGDGLTNLEEFQAGSDPNTPPSSTEPPPAPDAQPAASADSRTTERDTATVVPVLGNDSGLDDGPLTVTVISSPANGSASVQSDLTVRYTPAAGFTGSDSFTYRVSDADGDAATASVSISVVCSSCADGITLTYSWNPSPGTVDGYRVYRGGTLGGATELVTDLATASAGFNAAAPSVSFDAGADLSLVIGETVCFRLKAYNAAGASPFSTGVCGTVSN